jgi:hypothetical protein
MLFDLRGRGRRRTVQVVYLGLAILFLLGFVGFGVGVGGGGGGIFNALTEGGGNGSASFAGKVAAAQRRVKAHPTEAAAWAALAEAELHQASESEYSNSTSETEPYTPKGKALLAKVSNAWQTYLRLEPHHPSPELATRLANTVYIEQGLALPADGMRAMQIEIASKPPSAALYSALAEYAYKAGNARVGDAAASKAVKLAPSTERKRVKKYLAEIKKAPLSHARVSISKEPNGTYVATQAGKTYPVAPNGKGGFTGTVGKTTKSAPTKSGSSTTASTTTVPAGGTSSTKKK